MGSVLVHLGPPRSWHYVASFMLSFRGTSSTSEKKRIGLLVFFLKFFWQLVGCVIYIYFCVCVNIFTYMFLMIVPYSYDYIPIFRSRYQEPSIQKLPPPKKKRCCFSSNCRDRKTMYGQKASLASPKKKLQLSIFWPNHEVHRVFWWFTSKWSKPDLDGLNVDNPEEWWKTGRLTCGRWSIKLLNGTFSGVSDPEKLLVID